MNSWEVICLITGIVWVLTWLYLFLYREPIKEALQKEAVHIRKSVDDWTSDPNYYANKAGLKSPSNYNKKL